MNRTLSSMIQQYTRIAFAAIAILFASLAPAQTVAPAPVPHQFFPNSVGVACAGCSLYTYAAGTTTPLATYTSATGTGQAGAQNTNPIILDVSGSANIWLVAGSTYKFVLQDMNGSTLWSVDNIPGSSGSGGSSTGGYAGVLPLTSSRSALNSDCGYLIALNGFTYTLPYPEPSCPSGSPFEVGVQQGTATDLGGVALGGGTTVNGFTAAPILPPLVIMGIYADTTTTTNYRATLPSAQVSPCYLPGSTADVQINAALASIPSGGTVDARCYGATTQTIASNVAWGTSNEQTIIFDKSTTFQPSSPTVTMFTLGIYAHSTGLNIGAANQASYSVPAITIQGSASPVNTVDLTLLNTRVNIGGTTAGSMCLQVQGNLDVSFDVVDKFSCYFGATGIQLISSGTGYITANSLSHLHIVGSLVGLDIDGGTGTYYTAGNSFSNVEIEAGSSYPFWLHGHAQGNTIAGLDVFDASTPGLVSDAAEDNLLIGSYPTHTDTATESGGEVNSFFSGNSLTNMNTVDSLLFSVKGNTVLPFTLTGYHGSSGTNVQLSDGTGTSGACFFASDGSCSATPSAIIASGSSNLPQYVFVSEPSLATSNIIGIGAGTAQYSANNSGACGFQNVGGTGSASNLWKCGIYGAPTLDVDGAGNLTLPGPFIGAAVAPSGSCSIDGQWILSQDGHATVCLSGTWTSKI